MLLDALSRTFSGAPVAHVKDLLISLNKMMSSGPSSHTKDPPPATVRFIERIESANPHAPDIDEDDTNFGWGHLQFTAGGITLRSVFKTWSDVGNIPTAYRLLAASLKTCLVARHLCVTNKISVQSEFSMTTSSSYLSDVYFQQVVEILWDMVSNADLEADAVSSIILVDTFLTQSLH